MSRERRFFAPELTDEVVLDRQESHHLTQVLRLAPGDDVVLFDGKGSARHAVVTATEPTGTRLELGRPEAAVESPLSLTMAVGLVKGDKMAYLVQKLTELGVVAIAPILSDHVDQPARDDTRRLERWQRIALAAVKQSGRSRIPRIDPAKPLAEIVRQASGEVFLMAPGAKALPAERTARTDVTVLIGPEGGWSRAEIDIAAERMVPTFGLGPRTLRTETAAVVAAALFQWSSGDGS